MKRSILLAAGIILFLLATVRLIFKTSNKIDDEMQSYVQNLHYNFTAKVDSIIVLNKKKKTGFLACQLTKGTCNRSTEDSLNHHLTNYKWIRFLRFQPTGQFYIFLGNISQYHPNDSITVNSDKDEFKIFRNGERLHERQVSIATTQKVAFAFWIQD